MFEATDSTTFMGLEARSTSDLATVHAVILGAPCATPYSSVGPYCAGAPAAIRRASRSFSATRHHINFDLGGPVVNEPADIAVDGGDIAWDAADDAGNRQRITDACEAVLAAGAVPLVMGGDDSIPIPVVAAYASRPDLAPLVILQIDAHIDWRDEVQGTRMGLSSTMRRVSEMAHVGAMIQVGRRGSGSARPADAADAAARGVHFVDAREVHRSGTAAIVERIPIGANVFVTIDVDGLDPAIMPGVIGPEPGGLTYYQALDLIDGASERGRIVGFDVVEFVPERDPSGIGALTAYRLTAHALGRILRARPDAPAG
jgi:agmatinase